MLGAALFTTMKTEYEKVIDMLGVPMAWTHVKTSTTANVTAGMKIATDEDTALVQSYGIGARIITVKASDFTIPPEKFDRFAVQSEVYIAEAVAPVHLNGTLLGYRVYIRGK
jgi:hypothetical protein